MSERPSEVLFQIELTPPKLAGEAHQPAAPAPLPVMVRMPLGLGDWVETWAKPLGCWLDRRTTAWPKRWRTKLCGCMACSGRKAHFNAWLPDLGRWEGGWQVGWRIFKATLKRVFRLQP